MQGSCSEGRYPYLAVKKTMTTRNQLKRLLAIHDKLSTNRHYSLNELQQACATATESAPPSERTLYNDLEYLRDHYQAPISKGDRSGYPYRYTKPGFSLYAKLNPEDTALANEVTALLKQLSHLPQFSGLEDVFLKFEQRAGIVGRAEQAVMQFEQNPDYTGLRWLEPLYEAIRAEHPLLIDYCDFQDQRFRFEVSPYLLKEYTNRWYVFGWVSERSVIYNLALDRIEKLTPLPSKRQRPDQTDWTAEFADIIGVTRTQDPPETLVLRVYLLCAHYVRTKPLHPSQQLLTQTDTYVDFTYTLRWNYELMAQLLELGPDAELLEPLHRREQLAEKVRQLAARYNTL